MVLLVFRVAVASALAGARPIALCVFMESEWDGFIAAGFAPAPESYQTR